MGVSTETSTESDKFWWRLISAEMSLGRAGVCWRDWNVSVKMGSIRKDKLH